MNESRDSFDLRAERLRSMAPDAKAGGRDTSKEPTSAASEVDDWIKSVRALKEKRLAEDEARNNQLEEDILRERKARQERRATRTRSISPVKSLSSQPSSPQPNLAGRNGKGLLDTASEINHQSPNFTARSLQAIDGNTARDDSEKIQSAKDNGLIGLAPRDHSRPSILNNKPDLKSAPTAAHNSHSQLQDLLKKRRESRSPDRPETFSRSIGTSRSSPVAVPAKPSQIQTSPVTKSEPRSGIASVSQQHMSKLADIFAGRSSSPKGEEALTSTKSIDLDQKSDTTSAQEGMPTKLTHMTKNRARKQKTKQPSTAQLVNTTSNVTEENTSKASPSTPLAAASQADNTISRSEHPSLKSKPVVKSPSHQSAKKFGQSNSPSYKALKVETRVDSEGKPASQDSPAVVTSRTPPASITATSSPSRLSFEQSRPQGSPSLPTGQKPEMTRKVETPSSPYKQGRTPFGSGTRTHKPTKSVVSMTSVTDLIRSRANSLDLRSPVTIEETKQADIEVWSFSDSASTLVKVSALFNVLQDNEVRIIHKAGVQDDWYAWIGPRSSDAYKEHLHAPEFPTELVEIRMGEESADFMSCFENRTVITEFASQAKPALYMVRSHFNGFTIDQVPCKAISLCSGFAYVLVDQAPALWIGRGCHTIESRAASAFLRHHKSIDSFKTISEGSEPQGFWQSLGSRSPYASSAYWRLKRDISSYTCTIYTVNSSQVVQSTQTSPNSFLKDKVYVIDTFFEVYLYLSTGNSKQDISIAIEWVKNHCRSLANQRPFVPMVLALCPGSKLPRDLRAVFRGAPAELGTDLRVLELSALESLLKRSCYTIREFREGMAFDVDLNALENFVAKEDFAQFFGVDRQSFDRMSAAEQKRARDTANKQLASLKMQH